MGKHDRCCVGACNNDKRYRNSVVKRSHVKELKWHKVPSNPTKKSAWIKLIGKGRACFSPGNWTYVCSNHFIDGEPTTENPNPALFLTQSEVSQSTPKKRIPIRQRNPAPEEPKPSTSNVEVVPLDDDNSFILSTTIFDSVTREHDVRFYTGFTSPKIFQAVFNHLKPKALMMTYWCGSKTTILEESSSVLSKLLTSGDIQESLLDFSDYTLRPGQLRKLDIEQEFFLIMMKIRLGLLQTDIAYRFDISPGKVSEIFITWIKLMSKELGVLIIWPSKIQVRQTLPDCFKRLYPRVRTIIDCTEVYTETPCSLECANLLWSEYKHHHTIKFLICITPNGSISWVSKAYGGRTSDVHIVRNSGFLRLLEPYDEIMADRGFKIKTDLALHQCLLCIPPSAAKGNQMTSSDCKKTSQIANVRIYVEQAIKKLKDFRILKNELMLLYFPVVDDIIKVCCALNNLKEPLKV